MQTASYAVTGVLLVPTGLLPLPTATTAKLIALGITIEPYIASSPFGLLALQILQWDVHHIDQP